MSSIADQFVEPPRVDWRNGRPFAISRLDPAYADELNNLALSKESTIKDLPIARGWDPIADKNPTTARYASYSAFLLSPATHLLYFAIRETYRHLLQALDQEPAPRFIQCWYNIHRVGDALPRHKHPYPFIGTFSAHAEGSVTRYGETRESSEADTVYEHAKGQLCVTTGKLHYHETSAWVDPETPRVTYAFDIMEVGRWTPEQIFVPFDF